MGRAARGTYWAPRALLHPRQDPLSTDSPQRRALRTAQDAIASKANTTRTDPLPAHRAIITDLEAVLGTRRPPGELMARARVHADLHHDDWFASLFQLGYRADHETFDWARNVVEDTSCLESRMAHYTTREVELLAAVLEAESADPLTARLAAGCLVAARQELGRENWRRIDAGRSADEAHPAAVADADRAFALLADGLDRALLPTRRT